MSTEKIIWGDVETNGVEAFRGEHLLEVAVLITDINLNILDENGYHAVIQYDAKKVADMKAVTSPYVLNMHEKTGLWDKLVDGKPVGEVDDELLGYIKGFIPEPKTARLAGNSITLDRNFIDANLPKTFSHFHYRSYDVSSITGLAKAWSGIEPYKKKLTHAAMDDIRESIEELKYLRSKGIFPTLG